MTPAANLTPEQRRQNRRTSSRLDDWLDSVRKAPRRVRILRALAAQGMAKRLGIERGPERVAAMAPTISLRGPAAPATPRRACMSFEGCGGTGLRAMRPDGSPSLVADFSADVGYCDCAAGVSLRVADISRPR